MSRYSPERPATLRCGRIPTLNDRGFTTDFPDPLSQQFITYAIQSGSEVLDIGCAYGVAVKEILRAGGRVCASDMDLHHLEILQAAVPQENQGQLRCVPATLPDCDFAEASFGAILCSRVLHFLEGDQVDRVLAKMYHWLKADGKLFLVVDSPFAGATRDRVAPIYERNKAQGMRWPGFVPDFESIMPPNSGVRFDTSFIHFMDPDTLSQACVRANFVVEKASYMARIANLAYADELGRDHAVVVARKSNPN